MLYSSRVILLISIACLINTGVCEICDTPQKTAYESYEAMSNRDYMSDLFEEINGFLPTYNMTHTDTNGSKYSFTNMKPGLYYNEHHQTENYHDSYSVRVTMGQLLLSYSLNYAMHHEQGNFSGYAYGTVLVDNISYLKTITVLNGSLQWDPKEIPNITLHSQLSLDQSDPKLKADELAVFIQMLNDHVGDKHIKADMVEYLNSIFRTELKKHLNKEELFSNMTIHYKYRDLPQFDFTHSIKEFKMANKETKGLEVFIMFGMEDVKQNCTVLPTEFDQKEFGGIQEIYSLSNVEAIIIGAIYRGLYNTTLGAEWDGPTFQFFMGDLANFVEYANHIPANTRIQGHCELALDRINELKVSKHSDHEIYVQVPEECTIKYNNQPVLKASMDLNVVVRLIAEFDYIATEITNTGIYGIKFESIDEKWKVTNTHLAQTIMGSIWGKMIGHGTFGDNWQILERRYPSLKIQEEYIVIFDASQK